MKIIDLKLLKRMSFIYTIIETKMVQSIFQNIPADIEFECVKCNSCGCHYNGSENNRYGYFNCCYQCGENKYEDECIIEEEKKKNA